MLVGQFFEDAHTVVVGVLDYVRQPLSLYRVFFLKKNLNFLFFTGFLDPCVNKTHCEVAAKKCIATSSEL